MKHTLTVSQGLYCWLFGGIGFHNSEATMTRIMPQALKNEFVLKTFREISPSFARVFAGYADWTKASMDAFADYYDAAFRRAGTTLYVVPGRMPYMSAHFDLNVYAEQVAQNLSYLIRERGCRKIRYYCAANELSVGNTYCWFGDHMDAFRQVHEALYEAFRRHGLDIGLMAPDASGYEKLPLIDQTMQTMDELTEAYCWHCYDAGGPAGDPGIYPRLLSVLSEQVQKARVREKRFVLGEFGIASPTAWQSTVMRNDVCSGYADESEAALAALSLAEEEMAVLNSGCLASACWTFMDYPEPFLREDGDTPQEHDCYECARFSGHGISIRYNKWGLFRWNEQNRDYRSRPLLYTLGPLARYFRKNSRVLTCTADDPSLISGAVIDSDGGISLCLINHSDAPLEIDIRMELPRSKPWRCFAYDTAHVPYSPFNDLQPFSTLSSDSVTVPAMGMLLLTTAYTDRTPSPVTDIVKEGGRLFWAPCTDADHCYYRVFLNGEQIASTVAESLTRDELPEGEYRVCSVDRWGNV